MKKVDLKAEFKHLYQPSAKAIAEVKVPRSQFLTAHG